MSELISIKEQDGGFSFGKVYVHKYSKKSFYKGLWDEKNVNARGHIYDEGGVLIVNPFKKTFNWGVEPQADHFDWDEPVWAFKKINGFMVAVSYHKGEVIVSTTGSVNSPFVSLAKDHVNVEKFNTLFCDANLQDYTLLFECVHEKDPHIIDHDYGLYFLGARFKSESGSELNVPIQNFPDDYTRKTLLNFFIEEDIEWDSGVFTTFGKAVLESKYVEHEGFMVYDVGFQKCVKLKSPYYLLKKLVMRSKVIGDEKFWTKWYEIIKGRSSYVLDCLDSEVTCHQDELQDMTEQQRGIRFDTINRWAKMWGKT